MPGFVCISHVAHKSPTRNRRVDFVDACEQGIVDRKCWASFRAEDRFGNSTTEISQQHLKMLLFVGLRHVVRWPILFVCRLLDGLCDRHCPRRCGFSLSHCRLTLNDDFDGIEMLACLACRLEIRTRTKWCLWIRNYGVFPVSGLRWNNPSLSFLDQLSNCCNHHPALFSRFTHDSPPVRNIIVVHTDNDITYLLLAPPNNERKIII